MEAHVALSTEVVAVMLVAIAAAVHSFNARKERSDAIYFSLRNQLSVGALALTLSATYLGNWIVILPADFAGAYSAVGTLLYIISSIMPVALIAWMGPKFTQYMKECDFTSTDFYYRRYGRGMHLTISLFSLASMFLTLCAELSTLDLTFAALVGHPVSAYISILPVSIVTLCYTSYGGLLTSIFTDKIQAIGVFILGIIVVSAAVIISPPPANFFENFVWNPPGAVTAGVVLILSITPAEFLNQGNWQRSFAARSPSDARKAFAIAGTICAVTQLLFGALGMISKAINPDGNGSIFELLNPFPLYLKITALLFAVFLVMSSVDSHQNAISSLFGRVLLSNNTSIVWAQLITLILNIPAVVIASLRLDIFSLLVTANLLGCAAFVPQLFALSRYPTAKGALCSVAVGILAIFVVGWIYEKSFIGGLAFIYVSDIAKFPYIVACIASPLSALITLYFVSFLDRKICGSEQESPDRKLSDKPEDESVRIERTDIKLFPEKIGCGTDP